MYEVLWCIEALIPGDRCLWYQPECQSVKDNVWHELLARWDSWQHINTPFSFTSKSLSNTKQWYSNIEWEALGIPHGLEKFHHYCFTKKVYIIIDQMLLAAMVSKGIVTLPQWATMHHASIQLYIVHILYKAVLVLYIAHWLSHHSHTENRDQEATGINMSICTISTKVDVPACRLIEDIRAATSEDTELQILQAHKIKGRPQNKNEIETSLDGYWPIRHNLAMINGLAMKDRCIIVWFALQKQILDQLHSNHIEVKRIWLLVRESV